jgi:hypothetical protein
VEITVSKPRSHACAGERPDHVIRFHALDFDDRPAERGDRLAQGSELRAQLLRHRLARGLVFGIERVAESLSRGIENAGDIIEGKSCLSLRSMFTTPRMAPVGSPEGLRNSGSAWNAR